MVLYSDDPPIQRSNDQTAAEEAMFDCGRS